MPNLVQLGQARDEQHRWLADREVDALSATVGDTPAWLAGKIGLPSAVAREIDRLQLRAGFLIADAGHDGEPSARHDRDAIRSRTRLEHSTGREAARIEPRHLGPSPVGHQDLTLLGDHTGGFGKSVEAREVTAAVVVDHLDPVTRGMRHENASADRIERAVIEGASHGIRKLDDGSLLERHWWPNPLEGRFVPTSSTSR